VRSSAAIDKLAEIISGTVVEEELQIWWGAEVKKTKARAERIKDKAVKVNTTVASSRTNLEARKNLECEKLRTPIVDALKKYMKAGGFTPDDLFLKIRGADEGGVTEEEFVTFIKEKCECEKGGGDVAKFFIHVQAKMGGSLNMDNLLHLVRMYHKVLESTVITAELSIKDSKVVRRLKVGELVEVSEGPSKEPSVGLMRVKCTALKDGAEGWVTVAGNHGTTYLQEGGNVLKASDADTPLEEGGAREPLPRKPEPPVVRKLKKNEQVETLEWEQATPECEEPLRVRVLCKSDGAVGWVVLSKLVSL